MDEKISLWNYKTLEKTSNKKCHIKDKDKIRALNMNTGS